MANSLNKVTTKSILDATVATADIADDAVTADKLANAINTDIAAKAVLTGSTNNTITTVTGANAIQGEANLTFDGDHLTQTIDADAEGFNQTAAGNHYIKNEVDANRSGADAGILATTGKWNGKEVAAIKFRTGADTTNKDDGVITFETSSANNIAERMRIDSNGNIGMAGVTSPRTNLDLGLGQLSLSHRTDYSIRFYNGAGNNWSAINNPITSDGTSNSELGFNVAQGRSLHLHTAGAVTKPKQPSASAYFSSTDAGGNGGKISNDYGIASSTRWNIGSHYSTSTGKFTCPVAGKYAVVFSSNISLSNLSVGENYAIRTRKNGGDAQINYDTIYNTNWQHLGFTNILDCAANDYIQLFFSSSGNKTFGVDNAITWNQVHFYLLH